MVLASAMKDGRDHTVSFVEAKSGKLLNSDQKIDPNHTNENSLPQVIEPVWFHCRWFRQL